ncbi:MAG: SphA family protein [Pseudomonas sp.]
MATENGNTNWPLGVQTVVPAILPAPGSTQFYSYSVFYNANSYRDNAGHSSLPGFKLDTFVQAVRVVHTWDYQPDNGIKLSSGIIGTADTLEVQAYGQKDRKTGMKQVYLSPLYLTYSPSDTLHLLTGFNVFLPVGGYDKKDLANTSSNYATYTQEFALTWFPSPSWEVSIEPTVSINQRNKDTDYRSGDVFDVDYLLGYRIPALPQLQVGLVGYYTHQFTNDTLNGADLPDARLEKLAYGPQLFYAFNKSSGVVVKWMHESVVKNGPKGDGLWFEATFPL